MGMWDDWKDNITKAFRYVPMVDTAMDVYDLLSGKTPDQIAENKTKEMANPLDEWNVEPRSLENMYAGDIDSLLNIHNTGEDMSLASQGEQEDKMADELLNDNDDLWTPTPEQQAQIDASSNPALTEAILRDKDPSLWDNITDWLGDTVGSAWDIATTPYPDEYGDDFVDKALIMQKDPAGNPYMGDAEQIMALMALDAMMDPQDPNTLEGIKEDLATALAENDMTVKHIREWMNRPSFDQGFNIKPNDYSRLGYSSADDIKNAISPFLDYVDATRGNMPPSYTTPDMWGSVVGGYWGKDKFLETASNPDLYNKDTQKIITMFQEKQAESMWGTPGAGLKEPPGAMRDMGGTMDSAMASAMASDALGLEGQGATTFGTQTGTQPGTGGGGGGGGMREDIDKATGKIGTLDSVLSKVFYGHVYSMPDEEAVGSPEVREMLPKIYENSIILFHLLNKDAHGKYPEGWSDKDPQIPASEWSGLEAQYKTFLNNYFASTEKGPVTHQKEYYGKQLQDTVDLLNAEITRSYSGNYITSGDSMKPNALWREVVLGNVNLLELAKLYNTRGRRDKNANAIRNSLDAQYTHHNRMGKSNEEIFQLLTSNKRQERVTPPRYGDPNFPTTPGMGEDRNKTFGDTSNVSLNVDPLQNINNQWGGNTTYGTGMATGTASSQPTPQFSRPDQQVLYDAIKANLQRTGLSSFNEAGQRTMQPDPSVQFQAVKGLSSEHLGSMPLAFNDAENAKKMQGLPYITLRVADGQAAKGTTFVPTRGYQSGTGSALRKKKIREALGR